MSFTEYRGKGFVLRKLLNKQEQAETHVRKMYQGNLIYLVDSLYIHFFINYINYTASLPDLHGLKETQEEETSWGRRYHVGRKMSQLT
jgi:hypothetical protein